MLLQEEKEVFPVHKIQLAGLHRLHRHLIGLACHNRIQAENFSRFRDPQDQGFSVAGSGADLGLALTQQEDPTRSLSFYEDDDAASRKNPACLILLKASRDVWDSAQKKSSERKWQFRHSSGIWCDEFMEQFRPNTRIV